MKPLSVSGGKRARHAAAYRRFRGVDFSSDPSNVASDRSPFAKNLISDASGYPEKRPGWRSLCNYGARIHGIHRFVKNGAEHFIIHAGSGLYLHGAEPTPLCETQSEERSFSVVCAGKLWILTGAEYLYFDGEVLGPVSDIAHAPTTVISASPAGGGTAFEPVNLLTGRRKNSFLGNGASTVYSLDSENIDGVFEISVNGESLPPSSYSVNAAAGTVSFQTPPPAPGVTGQDNVIISFSKTVPGAADSINKCRFAGLFGLGGANSDRVFFSGNPEKQSVDWHCEISAPGYNVDPSYVPDTSYAYIGSDGNAVMGYRRHGAYQLIIKAQNDQDASVFLRSAALDSQGNTAFGLTQGAAGTGAVSMHAFATLGDEPLFLARGGICGVVTSSVTNVTNIQNRSYYADRALLSESGLENACAVEWKGFYILCVNSRCYILDSMQQKSFNAKSGGSYVYECYYWTNVPAVALCEANGTLYFGTADGRFCRFNTDLDDTSRYSDDGEGIEAVWSTKSDDDGDFGRTKSVNRRACAIMVKPETHSDARVYISTQKAASSLVSSYSPDRFSFEGTDFEDFSFDTGDTIEVFPINRRIKDYVTLQIIVKNDAVNENFGVCGIIKRFMFNTYVR